MTVNADRPRRRVPGGNQRKDEEDMSGYLIGKIRGVNISADVRNGTDANVMGAILKGMLATCEQFRWRAVGDELPASGGPMVLVAWERTEPENAGAGAVCGAYYFEEQWWFDSNDDDEPVGSHIRITHWMPMPSRPAMAEQLNQLLAK